MEMRSRQTSLSPLLRSFALIALVFFVTAQTLCFMHCNLGGGICDSAAPSCSGAVPGQTCHAQDGPVSPAVPAPTPACFALKNFLASGDASTLVVPDFCILYLLAPYALALDLTPSELEAPASGRAKHLDWIFTPEVSLGPAVYSLPPPVVG
jgi:hypothetical protein